MINKLWEGDKRNLIFLPFNFSNMIIEEKDFKIIEHEKSYTLLITKFGKEAKDEEKHKVYGYYTTIDSALKAAYKYRSDKKYPGKESPEKLKELYLRLLNLKTKLNFNIFKIDRPTIILKKKLLSHE